MAGASDGADENYYAILNIPKDASADEVKNAYRRLCVLYHPDKHQTEERQTLARELFPRIQTAYAVLSDPQKRAIYDIYGASGVSAGYDLAPYYGTTAELKAEFEMQKRRQEEERRQTLANASVTMEVSVDATQVFAARDEDEDVHSGLFGIIEDIEISSMSAQQSIETQLNEADTLRLTGALLSRNGRGAGNLALTLRHQHAGDWYSEFGVGAGTGRNITLKTQMSFGAKMQASAEAALQEVRQQGMIILVPSFTAVLYRTLTQHTYTALKFAVSPREINLTSTAVYHTDRMQASSSLQFGQPTSFLRLTLKRSLTDATKLRGSLKIGLDGVGLSYGIERTLTEDDKISLSLHLEMDGVTLKLKYQRVRQTYSVPIWLSDALALEPVVYGTAIPALVYVALHRFVIVPYARRQQETKKLETRRRNRALIAQRRREAFAAVQLMQETVARKIEAEEAVGGLIIEEALYGELVTAADRTASDDAAVINVTVPLQCMVRESQLITNAYSKADLVGFYDPIPDEPKQLRVRYRFQGRLHQVTVDDKAELRIPRKADLVPEH
eukprot:m.243678 g.243678  ORF g.243678 m.243678 type:complete len:558 (-) comp14285_c0_seq1:99-1772(-)